MNRATGLSYSGNQVRRHDHDRYLTTLFVPAADREAVLALFAFNLEIARVRESVSEPMLGQIRLQWWRDAINEIYAGTERQHPVVQHLAIAIRGHGLTREKLDELVDTREFDLTDGPPATLPELEDYAAGSSGALLELVQEVLGQHGRASPITAARHIGIAWSLVGLIRAFPYHARTKRLFLPAGLLDSAGIDRRQLFERATAPGLSQVVEQLVVAAEKHLTGARALRPEIPTNARAGLLLATLATTYIRAIRRASYEPSELPQNVPGRIAKLVTVSLLRRY